MNYNNIAPQGTFIHSYLQHMSEQETATAYDFWCAIWMLSCAVNRHVIVDRPRAPVYLNVYAILVAESGVTRKSSAVRSAFNIIREFNEAHNDFTLIESKITPERMEQVLHDRYTEVGSSKAAIAISELAVFLGTSKYTQDMPALLTDLYDCPTSRSGGGTISRGGSTQRDVWVSFLSASTPSWLFRSVNPNIVQGGFTSRCLFIVEEKPKRRVAWPSDIQKKPNELVSILKDIQQHGKKFKAISIQDGALKLFSTWYNKRTHHIDDFRASFESREDAHILRLAALLCINDDTWIIQKSHITNSIKIIEHCKSTASTLFEGTNARSKWIMGLVSIRDRLLQSGTDTMPRSQLYLCCRKNLDNAEFSAILDVMHEMELIQRFEVKKPGKGRPLELIRGTDGLTKRGIVETLSKELGYGN